MDFTALRDRANMLLKYLTTCRFDIQLFHAYMTLHVASLYGG